MSSSLPSYGSGVAECAVRLVVGVASTARAEIDATRRSGWQAACRASVAPAKACHILWEYKNTGGSSYMYSMSGMPLPAL